MDKQAAGALTEETQRALNEMAAAARDLPVGIFIECVELRLPAFQQARGPEATLALVEQAIARASAYRRAVLRR